MTLVFNYTLPILETEFQFIKDVNPDIVIVEIGSNDLCNNYVNPVTFAHRLVTFCQSLISNAAVKK